MATLHIYLWYWLRGRQTPVMYKRKRGLTTTHSFSREGKMHARLFREKVIYTPAQLVKVNGCISHGGRTEVRLKEVTSAKHSIGFVDHE